MKKIISKIIGAENYLKLEEMKKKIMPTDYDKKQKKYLDEQILFYSEFINSGALCFDIGANVGFKTNVFLKIKARVVALEPQKECIKLLSAKFGSKAVILQKGAGAKNEIKEFYISNNSELSSFNDKWVGDLNDGRFTGSVVQNVEKVEVVTLDSLIDIYGRPDFIKIDVEGYENEVLKGLNRSFGCLAFEYTVPEKLNEISEGLKIMNDKYSNLMCNYAVGNYVNSFVLPAWISITDMMELVKKQEFANTFAGDIYIKTTGL